MGRAFLPKCRSVISTMVVLPILVAGFGVSAQTLPGPSTDPGQLEMRFKRSEVLTPLPDAPSINIPQAPDFAPPGNAAALTFTLVELTVRSAVPLTPGKALVYGQRDFAPIIEPILGKTITVADLFTVADAITAHYSEAGYALSFAYVPAQTIDNGTVRIEVVEGFVDHVEYDKALEQKRPGLFKDAEARLLASRPLHISTLEEFALLFNELPGLSITTAFHRSEKEVGAATLVLQSGEVKPVDASFSIDNRGSKAVGPYQAVASVRLNSVLGLYERTTLTAALTPDQELRYFAANQEHILNAQGTRAHFGGSYSRSKPGGLSQVIDTRSNGDTINLGVRHPLIQSRRQALHARADFTYRNSRTRQLDTTSSQDRVRYLEAGLSFSHRGEVSLSQIGVTASKGLDLFGATETNAPRKSRADGDPTFMTAQFDASHTWMFAERMTLRVLATGQWAADGLLSSQEFGLGGEAFGRAFDPSEITGDSGLAGGLEVSYALPLSLPRVRQFDLYGFYDIGRVWNKNTMNGEPDRQSLASAGAGLRLGVTEYLSGAIEIAKPLTRDVADKGDRDPRLFFRLTAAY